MNNKVYITILIICVFLVSCGSEYYYNRNTKLLIQQNWKVNTFIDYSQNSTVDIRIAIYDFKEDGQLIKTYENNDTVMSEWKLSSDAQYLTIGSNTFFITDITKRVMSLRYGEVELFFIEAE